MHLFECTIVFFTQCLPIAHISTIVLSCKKRSINAFKRHLPITQKSYAYLCMPCHQHQLRTPPRSQPLPPIPIVAGWGGAGTSEESVIDVLSMVCISTHGFFCVTGRWRLNAFIDLFLHDNTMVEICTMGKNWVENTMVHSKRCINALFRDLFTF